MTNVTRIRARIVGEVDRLREAHELLTKHGRDQDVEPKIKLSTRACNPEGLMEKELRAREQQD